MEWLAAEEKLFRLRKYLFIFGSKKNDSELEVVITGRALDSEVEFRSCFVGFSIQVDLLKDFVAVSRGLSWRVGVVRGGCVRTRNREKAEIDDEPSMRRKTRYRDISFQVGHAEP